MDREKLLPTRGQLERQLSQTLQSLYRQEFGHLLGKVTCHIFADKVAIVAEDTVTNIEKILLDNSKLDLACSIRTAISKAFTSQVQQATAEILEVGVIDLIVDSTIDNGYLGIIIFLDASPQVRLAKRKKLSKQNLSNSVREEVV